VTSTGYVDRTSRSKPQAKREDEAIRNGNHLSDVPVNPDEVLFRKRGAPDRYEEDDFYWADRHLDATKDQALPDSDLLKAVHAYVADFYSRAIPINGDANQRSMDETALLACGILLEEAAKSVLGESGDMVFVEAEDVESENRSSMEVPDQTRAMTPRQKSAETRRGKPQAKRLKRNHRSPSRTDSTPPDTMSEGSLQVATQDHE